MFNLRPSQPRSLCDTKSTKTATYSSRRECDVREHAHSQMHAMIMVEYKFFQKAALSSGELLYRQYCWFWKASYTSLLLSFRTCGIEAHLARGNTFHSRLGMLSYTACSLFCWPAHIFSVPNPRKCWLSRDSCPCYYFHPVFKSFTHGNNVQQERVEESVQILPHVVQRVQLESRRAFPNENTILKTKASVAINRQVVDTGMHVQ